MGVRLDPRLKAGAFVDGSAQTFFYLSPASLQR